MTADLTDLLTMVADSVPPPSLLDGVRARRRSHVHRRQVAGAAVTVALLAGGVTVGWQVHQTSVTNAKLGAAAGYQEVPGPNGWPSARLAPPVLAPVEGFEGQAIRLDPLPAGTLPGLSAEQAYSACTGVGGSCGRNAGAVLTLALVTFDNLETPMVRRLAWLIVRPPGQCAAATPASASSAVAPAPVTRICRLVEIRDANTGAVLTQRVDG